MECGPDCWDSDSTIMKENKPILARASVVTQGGNSYSLYIIKLVWTPDKFYTF